MTIVTFYSQLSILLSTLACFTHCNTYPSRLVPLGILLHLDITKPTRQEGAKHHEEHNINPIAIIINLFAFNSDGKSKAFKNNDFITTCMRSTPGPPQKTNKQTNKKTKSTFSPNGESQDVLLFVTREQFK